MAFDPVLVLLPVVLCQHRYVLTCNVALAEYRLGDAHELALHAGLDPAVGEFGVQHVYPHGDVTSLRRRPLLPCHKRADSTLKKCQVSRIHSWIYSGHQCPLALNTPQGVAPGFVWAVFALAGAACIGCTPDSPTCVHRPIRGWYTI